tara:strand:+ start:1175 stop:1741 length:567 start_codon:yes stop_codon:yes gene_type:complete
MSIQSPIIINKFYHHHQLKEKLLNLIDKSDSDQISNNTLDKFIKLDWNKSNNFERPWVKYINTYLYNQLISMVSKIGFNSIHINDLWYQQYGKNGQHNWHIHADNFTGVYYVELENDQYTQLLNPYNLNEAYSYKVQEGDFIVFPSYIIHRSGINITDKTRTIISYNFNVKEINKEVLKNRIIKLITI